jgi:transposase
MMGRRDFAPKLYYQLSLDRLVPADHLLRRIAEAMDFSFVYPMARPYYSHTGQPSVDPVVLFKALLIGYLYGITSERRLMDEIQVNLAYRWFLCYDLDEQIPDHSVLSKARVRFGLEVFEGFFQRSIELCREAGLLSEGPVYVDSTLVRAAASMDSLVERSDGVNPPYSVTEYVRRLYEENIPLPKEEEDSQLASPPSSLGGPETKVPPRYRKSRPDGHRRKANSELVSRTDPEATVISRRGFDMHLAYKAHMAVAGKKGQVITAAVATTGAKADEHLLDEVLWHHRRLSHLPIRDIVADAKYGTMTNYLYLHQAGMRAFIPSRHHKRGPGGVWGRDQFQYLPVEDEYLCPAEKRMRRFTRRASTRRVGYRVEKGACESCSFRERCTPSGGERTISRFFDHELIDEAEERVASVLGRRLLHERQVRSEGAFALAKELHGLRRTRFVGKRKVQVQLWLTAAAMNIKRAAKALRPLPAAAAAARAAVPGCPFSALGHSLILAKATTASACRP